MTLVFPTHDLLTTLREILSGNFFFDARYQEITVLDKQF